MQWNQRVKKFVDACGSQASAARLASVPQYHFSRWIRAGKTNKPNSDDARDFERRCLTPFEQGKWNPEMGPCGSDRNQSASSEEIPVKTLGAVLQEKHPTKESPKESPKGDLNTTPEVSVPMTIMEKLVSAIELNTMVLRQILKVMSGGNKKRKE